MADQGCSASRAFVLAVASVCAVCGSQAAFARIGETEAEIEQRFGRSIHREEGNDPTEPGDKCLHYLKGEVVVMVTFWKGRSVREDYKFRQTIEGESLKTAEAIFDVNANGQDWEKPANIQDFNPGLKHGWNSSEHEITGFIYRNSPDTLIVADRSYLEERSRRRKAAESGAGGF